MTIIISIHTPTRGATSRRTTVAIFELISIHAPTRGATLFWWPEGVLLSYFNPRSHEGSDMIAPYDWQLLQVFQSTLPRGERLGMSYTDPVKQEFQSTLPRGERHMLPPSEAFREKFQSTLPRGERRENLTTIVTIVNFNPRSHEGSDQDHRSRVW